MKTHREVIKRFGGIRAMARKLEHTNHTTVQGWWDRSLIPFERWSEIASMAEREGEAFDMSVLMPDAPDAAPPTRPFASATGSASASGGEREAA